MLPSKNQKGVFIPLLAVFVGLIGSVLVIFLLDLRLLRLTHSKAVTELESICAQGVKHLPISLSAVQVVMQQLNVLLTPTSQNGRGGIKNATVEKFRLIIPTASKNLPVDASDLSRTSFINAANPYVLPDCPSQVQCEFVGDLSDLESASSYPSNFWNPFGITEPTARLNDVFQDQIACEMDLRVETLVSGARTVSARTVWELKQRGVLYPNDSDLLLPDQGLRNQKGGGILIGISTAMNFSLRNLVSGSLDQQNRFRFGTVAPLVCSNSSSFASINPLRDFQVNFPPSNSDPLYLPGGLNTVNAFAYPRIEPSDGFAVTNEFFGIPSFAAVGAGAASSPRQERLAACFGPPIAVRNFILSHLVGLMGRMWLRDKTEILSINPIHYLPAAETDPYPINNLNPPTIMVTGGTDIIADQYQLPYVTYNYDLLGNNPQALNALNPLDRIRLGVLRDCYHMWGSSLNQLKRLANPALDNSGFESSEIQANSSSEIRYQAYDNSATFWDQDPNQISNLLSAEKLMYVLGSSQSCPQGDVGSQSGGANGWPSPSSYDQNSYGTQISCVKPTPNFDLNRRPSDLRGDVRAFMAYAAGQLEANLSPGFDASAPISTSPSFNFQTTHVLLFTHNRLTPREASEIRVYTDMINAQGRSITIIYMPIYAADASNEAVDRFREAFNVVYDTSYNMGSISTPSVPVAPVNTNWTSSSSSSNVLYIISPEPTTTATVSDQVWDNRFSDYWNNLLCPSQHNNFQAIADNIFHHRLTYPNLKF